MELNIFILGLNILLMLYLIALVFMARQVNQEAKDLLEETKEMKGGSHA